MYHTIIFFFTNLTSETGRMYKNASLFLFTVVALWEKIMMYKKQMQSSTLQLTLYLPMFLVLCSVPLHVIVFLNPSTTTCSVLPVSHFIILLIPTIFETSSVVGNKKQAKAFLIKQSVVNFCVLSTENFWVES